MRRSLVLLVIAAGVAATVVIVRALREDERGVRPAVPPPPVPPRTDRSGTPADRGRAVAYGLDLGELRQRDGFEPVVEYLTYIQRRRGQGKQLLFVRDEDLEALAGLEGVDSETFLEQLDQLGVVVSNN